MTFVKRSEHNFIREFKGRKKMKIKFYEANVLETMYILSENLWIEYKY